MVQHPAPNKLVENHHLQIYLPCTACNNSRAVAQFPNQVPVVPVPVPVPPMLPLLPPAAAAAAAAAAGTAGTAGTASGWYSCHAGVPVLVCGCSAGARPSVRVCYV